jgi:hypothetical protein
MHGYSSKAQQLIALLYEEEECRKPRKQSTEQKKQAKENIEKARENGGGFDQMPEAEHKKLSKEGGQAERKKKPECKDGEG